MGAMEEIVKVAKSVGKGAKRGAKNIKRVSEAAGVAARDVYKDARAGRSAIMTGGSAVPPAGLVESLKRGAMAGGGQLKTSLSNKTGRQLGEMGAVAGIPLLAALSLMSGGDEGDMAEMADASGIPMGGGDEDPVQSMRAAMIPKVKRRIMNEIESGKRPEKVLERIQNNVYSQLADANSQIAQETEGQYKADDLYKFSSALEQVLASQDTPTKKLAQLYALSGE